jgi:hypothetical protein
LELGIVLRVRRTRPTHELRHLPLDNRDMFIVSCVDGSVALVDLAELAPCGIEESMTRVRSLVAQGVLELHFDDEADERDLARARRAARRAAPIATHRNDPPTGVRLRLAADDMESRGKVLLGAIMLGRRRPHAVSEQIAIRTAKKRSGGEH